MDKLVLIDGHSILNRAFYGVPELTNSEGLHTNAVFGFLNIMFKILEEEKADHLAVAFDLSEPTFRHKMYDAYKGTRKPMPDELREQVPLIKEVLSSMNIPIMTLPGYEADDILGTVAKQNAAAGIEVSIISGDRDLLQLADEHIKIRIPKTSRRTTEVKDYYPDDVMREYKVTPSEFIDVKALMGDASDNIPGVPSIGEKTATSIIVQYKSIENAYANIDSITPPRARTALSEHYDLAKLSKELATICTSCPVPFTYADTHIGNLYTPEAYKYMKRLEFKSLLSRFDVAGDNVSEDIEKNFKLINDFTDAENIFSRAEKQPVIGMQFIYNDGKAVGLALCLNEKESCYIKASGFMGGDYLYDRVLSVLGSLSVKRVSVLDLKAMLPTLKLDFTSPVFDAGVAGYLLNPLKDTYHYDDLARDYLGMTIPAKEDLIGKQELGHALLEDDANAMRCACYMGYVLYMCSEKLEERLKATGMFQLFTDIEMPLIYSLYHMESAGIHVERNQLLEYGNRLKVKIAELEKNIYRETGREFNINSPKQLGEILFDDMKLPNGKKTKTGYSTAADVLEKLAPEYPAVRMILDYRQLAKLNSTYADGLAAYIKEDGRIHGTFNQKITATGRISSTEPNLQNIPVRMELGREIRKVFTPREGYTFVDADYSQIELRILAHMSGDEKLINAYKQAQDIHAITASEVFHTPLDKVTPLQRRNAKAVNFGIVYGISAFGLSEDLSISRKEAVNYINKYFETYPKVKQFLDGLVESAKEKGYVTTLYGRVRPIPELKSSNFMQRSFGERVAMNSPIQGTAADIMKIAMISVDKELRANNMKSQIVLQIHDELLVEAHNSETQEVIQILENKMKNAADLKVALEVEAHTGASWFDAK